MAGKHITMELLEQNTKTIKNYINKKTNVNNFTSETTDEKVILKYMGAPILEIPVVTVPLPAFSINLNATPNVVEKGMTTNVTLKWSYSDEISSQSLNGVSVALLDRSKVVVPTGTTTYTLTAVRKSDDSRETKTVTVNVVGASYYGVVNDTELTADQIKALNKAIKAGRGYNYSGIILDNQRVCYAYPSSMGLLTSIKDANGFDYLASYTFKNLEINGMEYNVYIMTDPTTIMNFKQTYA